MTKIIVCDFLQNFVEDVPFKIHTILTDNGAQFTYELLAKYLRPKNKIHPFDALCQKHKIKISIRLF